MVLCIMMTMMIFISMRTELFADELFEEAEQPAAGATEEQVDAVLVAGDVFDAQTVSDRTIRRLFNAMAGFTGRWIMIPGNHDAALAESVWTRAERIGAIAANINVLLEPAVREYPDAGFAILPAPLTQRQTASDLTAWFDTATTAPGLLRIGLAHGSVQGILAEEVDSPNPIAPDRTATAKLDYLALGDWHGLKQINERTFYSGTPEQERFKNNGAGQVLLVRIDAPGAMPSVTPYAVGGFNWEQWQATIQVRTDIDEFIERLGDVTPRDVLDIRIAGTSDLAGQALLQEALYVAEGKARSLQADLSELTLQPTDEDVAAMRADGYLGEVIDDLLAQQAGPEAETARDAMTILATLLRERNRGEA